MNKIKIKTPSYSLVACDLSGAEVRTSCNASKDEEMSLAYSKFEYEKEASNFIDLFSYEIIPNSNKNVSAYILDKGDYIIDLDNMSHLITKKEKIGDKIRFYFN